MSARYDSRDAAHSITSQMLFGLLFGNVLAILGVIAFRSGSGSTDRQAGVVLAVGLFSLVAAALLFLASAMRRRGVPWWITTLLLNVTQIVRLIPAVIAIAAWTDAADWAGALWTFLFLPFLGFLAGVGVVMTMREARKSRRRRLARAA
jgi:hypothetical protein